MISTIFGNKSSIVESLLLFSIGFKLKTKNKKTDAIKSKFGGYPNVPNDFIWPYLEKTPLSFLCQICLEELSNYDSDLPKKGILYFFILTEIDDFRFPEKENEFKVIYIEECRQDYSENKNNNTLVVFTENQIDFFEHYSFPSYQEYAVLQTNLNKDELNSIDEIYLDICEITGQSEDCGHQILGHPNALQGSVKYFWASKYINHEKLIDTERNLAGRVGESFTNLLQIDFSDPSINYDEFMGAVAYFGLHEIDLLEKNFDNAKIVMQNT